MVIFLSVFITEFQKHWRVNKKTIDVFFILRVDDLYLSQSRRLFVCVCVCVFVCDVDLLRVSLSNRLFQSTDFSSDQFSCKN